MNTAVKDDIFQIESEVKYYCRSFPVVFQKAKGSLVYSEAGKPFIDFFSGAGALNYGHNNDYIKQRLIDYLQSDAIIHGLDSHTSAKREFLEKLNEHVLAPQNYSYKVQFCGPTGTNAIEAALKLARKVKGRQDIFAFMGGFHGMSLGSLAASGQRTARAAAGVPLSRVTFIPFADGSMPNLDTIDYIETILADDRSGIEKPAAILFETVQGEGGVNVAPVEWMCRLRALCDRNDILLICDDVQVGCGRTGPFFSFERANIMPDMTVLSKSISGYGLPLAILLLKPELDVWMPGEHNGTFRANQLALVGGSAALEYRTQSDLKTAVRNREIFVEDYLRREIQTLDERIRIRGIGLIWGVDLGGIGDGKIVANVVARCFEDGLMLERAGRRGQVIKILPALNIEMDLLEKGCCLLRRAIADCLVSQSRTPSDFACEPLITPQKIV